MSAVTAWMKRRAGARWPVLVKAADGAVTTFLLTFVGYLTAHGVSAEHIGASDTWHAAAAAGGLAALNTVKSAVMVAITGQTALGGLVSAQLRAQRHLRPVHHPVPLREPRSAAKPAHPQQRAGTAESPRTHPRVRKPR